MGIPFAVRQVDIQILERANAFRYQSHQRHKRYRNAKPGRFASRHAQSAGLLATGW
jgi:hypothetical protein